MPRFCQPLLVLAVLSILMTADSRADDWPQWRGPSRDGTWTEKGLVTKFKSERIPHRWSVKIGPGYSGPTVANGRVYVTDRQTKPQQIERVLCFDESTGKELWKFSYDCIYSKIGYKAGPRACVTIHDGKAYALGAMGHLHCLDAAKGGRIWGRDLHKEYRIDMPIWGIASAPFIYQDLVIVQVGGDEACMVAFDQGTGKERWRALTDRASYTTPILVKQGETDVLICWTGDSLAGLDAKTGKTHWRMPFPPKKMPIGISTPIINDNHLFLTSFYDGCRLIRLSPDSPQATLVWKRRGENELRTDGLHSIISTPIFLGDHIYGVDSYGELRCLDSKDGSRIWENQTATPRARWSTIHFVKNGPHVWMFNEAGDLIISKLTPKGYQEISRTHLIDRTKAQLPRRGGVCWSHPAFANKCVFARSDDKLVCASLAAE